MKFADDVLLEIVNIVSEGIEKGIDVSDQLRNIDVVQDTEFSGNVVTQKDRVKLSEKYLASKGRLF